MDNEKKTDVQWLEQFSGEGGKGSLPVYYMAEACARYRANPQYVFADGDVDREKTAERLRGVGIAVRP